GADVQFVDDSIPVPQGIVVEHQDVFVMAHAALLVRDEEHTTALPEHGRCFNTGELRSPVWVSERHSLTGMIASHEDDASAALFLLPRDVRVSRGNHRLPRGHAHPSMRQGTADGHYAIADTHLPQAEPIFLALRGRRDAMALEDVLHRLHTDRQAQ